MTGHRFRTGSPPSRGGFTLLEILLALGLLMLVLAAAYSGIDLFRRVTVSGRADAERAQIARALERKIAADLRAVVFRAPAPATDVPAASESAGGLAAMTEGVGAADDDSGATTSAPIDTSEPTAEETAAPGPSLGLFGDAVSLTMHVSRPPRGGAFVLPVDALAAGGPLGDLRTVTYTLGGAAPGTTDPFASAGATAAYQSPYAVAAGLTRQEQGVVAVGAAATTAGDPFAATAAAAPAPPPVLLAGEVTELGFRYFDGAAWYDSWDSTLNGALPRAVEVTLRVTVAPQDRPRLQQSSPPVVGQAPAGSEAYRFVIALPASDPAPVVPAEEGV